MKPCPEFPVNKVRGFAGKMPACGHVLHHYAVHCPGHVREEQLELLGPVLHPQGNAQRPQQNYPQILS